jgi:hypothetical protein
MKIANIHTKLSSVDAVQFMRNKNYFKKFKFCFASDFIFDKNVPAYLINIDKTESNGVHWTALYCIDKNAYYFDSYGFPMNENIKNELFKNGFTIRFNAFLCQSLNSDVCGYYSILFLYYMLVSKSNNTTYSYFIYMFKDDVDYNDRLIVQLYNRLLT